MNKYDIEHDAETAVEHKFPCYRYFKGFICVYFKISQENLVYMNIICETVIKWNLTVTQLKLTVTYRKT